VVDAAPAVAVAILHGRRDLLERYADLLRGPGVERGLLGPREPDRLWSRHLLNCAVIEPLIGPGEQVLDLGSGAGLPGLVLACVRSDIQVTLVEPMARRVAFLEECVAAIGLTTVTVLRVRAEELAGQVTATTLTARAVAPLDRLVPMALPLLEPRGQLLAMKGSGAQAELVAARAALRRWPVEAADVVTCGEGVVETPTTVVRVRLGSAPTLRGRPGAASGARSRKGGVG
jgi:16S rRNA (guanine527-N7)-methyltransferase